MSRLSIGIVLVLAACGSSPGNADVDAAFGGDGPAASDGPAAAACTGLAGQPLDATWTITVGGAMRKAAVHVPASYDPTRATATLIDLHGLASSGADQERVSGLLAKSDSAGFIAIHPEGTGSPKGWNGGACCNPAASSGIDDTAFIRAVIDAAEAKLCVDPDRVFAMGFSNGGFLAHRLGCELSDRIAALGAVSGVLGIDTCTPVRPVPVLQVHGTSDLVIPYGGGGINNSKSVATTIAGWVARDGCTGSPQTTYQHGNATCVSQGGCAAGAEVTLCTIQGGGHQWPGGESSGALNGLLSNDLSATDAIWTFFQAHPRPHAE